MEVKWNFKSLFVLILVFTFRNQYTVGDNNGKTDKSFINSKVNPLLQAEVVQEPIEAYSAKVLVSQSANKDVPVIEEINFENDDDTPIESLESDLGSSASSSSEESDSNIDTALEPDTNRSLGVRENKMMKNTFSKLVKSRDTAKNNNWYAVKRSANGNEKTSPRPQGTKVSKQKQPNQQYINQKGRSVGGTGDSKNVNNDGDGSSPPGHTKPLGTTGYNKKLESSRHTKHLSTPGHNDHSGTPGHQKRSGAPGLHSTAEAGKDKNDQLGNKKYASGDAGQPNEDMRVNKTNVHPFSVRRSTSEVDPDVYSFFQFKPSQSIGFLWSQSASLPTFGGMFGRWMENDEEPEEEVDDPSILFDWEFKRYDRACLYIENNVYKSQLNSTQVTEDVTRMVDNQNEKLARTFLDWQFVNKEDHETIALKGEGENHPHYLTYKFLTITMEIFRDKICRNFTPYATTPEVKPFAPLSAPLKAEATKKHLDSKLLPKSFIDDLYRLFLTLRDITLPKGVPDYASKKDEQHIYTDVLDNCLKLDPIQWYSHSCADQVLSYDDPHNYACTPFVEYDFNVKEYDPILDGMWHMFTAVHGFCYDEFNKISTRLWHKYSMIMANSFTVGMRARWKASIAEPKFYRRLLGPDYKTHLETMNRCMFAATLRSGAPSVLPRLLSGAPLTFGKERTMGKDAFETHPKA